MVFTVKVNGKWVPMDTLPVEKQEMIRKRVVQVLQTAAERQIRLVIQREKDMARVGN